MPLCTWLYPPSSPLLQLLLLLLLWWNTLTKATSSFKMNKGTYCCIEHLLCLYWTVSEPRDDTRNVKPQKVMPLSLLQKQPATWCSCWGNDSCLSWVASSPYSSVFAVVTGALFLPAGTLFLRDTSVAVPSFWPPPIFKYTSSCYREAWLRNEHFFPSASPLPLSTSFLSLTYLDF